MSRKVSESDERYIVRKIHQRRKRKGVEEFLVEWEGFPNKKDHTWEPKKNLENCSLLYTFLEQTKINGRSKLINKSSKVKKDILVKLFTPTKRGTLSDKERLNIVIQQNMKCNLCLTSFHHLLHDLTFEVDHIIPLDMGGLHGIENLQALCPACHNYKTSILDKGVIARLLQAYSKTGEKLTRDKILMECQIYYSNRHRHYPPHQEDDMISFAISAREILNEFCQRKLDRILNMKDLMDDKEQDDEKKISIAVERKKRKKDVQPPKPPKKRKVETTAPLNRITFFIEQMECLKIESSVMRMDNFKLTISLNLDHKDKADKTSHEFGNQLNNFFRLCLRKKKIQEVKIKDVTLLYEEVV